MKRSKTIAWVVFFLCCARETVGKRAHNGQRKARNADVRNNPKQKREKL